MLFYDNLALACKENNVKIASIVKECGGAVGSIDGWKKGSIPRSDIVAKIALRLNVSTDFLILGENNNSSLTKREKELLIFFNSLSDEDKGRVLGKAETLAELATERAAQEAEKISKEKKKASGNSKLSVAVPAADEEPDQDEEFYIDLCNLPVSAGTGVYLDEGYTEPLQISRTAIAERANYAVRVSGNSMETKFYDGDIVLVKTCRL